MNLADGFLEPLAFNTWVFDAPAHTVALNDGEAVALTAAQIDGLVLAVTSAAYHVQDDCTVMSVDGAPYPPLITVSAGEASEAFGVSDADCAKSDHSAYGNVMSCGDFGEIFGLLEAAAPGGPAFTCANYW